MKCQARVPRAPGAHEDRGALAAHRCTKTANHSILVRKVATALCGTHYNQWKRRRWIEIWSG